MSEYKVIEDIEKMSYIVYRNKDVVCEIPQEIVNYINEINYMKHEHPFGKLNLERMLEEKAEKIKDLEEKLKQAEEENKTVKNLIKSQARGSTKTVTTKLLLFDELMSNNKQLQARIKELEEKLENVSNVAKEQNADWKEFCNKQLADCKMNLVEKMREWCVSIPEYTHDENHRVLSIKNFNKFLDSILEEGNADKT